MPRFRMAPLLLLMLVFVVPITVTGEEQRPARMIDLLKPGMKVGVGFHGDSGQISLNLYSDEEFAMGKEIGYTKEDDLKEKLPELREKYEAVEQRYQSALQALQDEVGDNRQSILNDPKMLARIKISSTYTFDRNYETIASVGEDYFELTGYDFPWEEPYRRVYSARVLRSILLDAKFIEIRVSGPER